MMKNIAKAITAVMSDVKNIEKSMTVGNQYNNYKGVADKDVKHVLGQAMQKHGLCIVPTSVEDETRVDRWEENGKQKQAVHVSVRTKYLLLHESGESIELAGYGHGVDPQDKAAGKATTYALKYALLYAFMVPTGDIDDADKVHSDTHQVAPRPAAPAPAPKVKLPLTPDHEKWFGAVAALAAGKTTIEKIKGTYTVTDAVATQLAEEAANFKA